MMWVLWWSALGEPEWWKLHAAFPGKKIVSESPKGLFVWLFFPTVCIPCYSQTIYLCWSSHQKHLAYLEEPVCMGLTCVSLHHCVRFPSRGR